MTATHDRRSDPRARTNALEEWGGRSVFGTAKGWPWWAAVVLALGLSIVGAFIDMHTSGSLGKVFEGAYILGCVGAVCLVRRRNLFGPMVQPPLILAVTVPVVVLLTKGVPSGSGMTSKLIALGVPLVTGFPTMAATTGATVVIGGIRFLAQRKPASTDIDDRDDEDRPARRRPVDRDGERGERSGAAARQRSASGRTGRPSTGRTSRDEPASSRDRADRASSARSEPGSREGRSASSRSGSDKVRERGGQSGDRDPGRARRPSSERGRTSERGEASDRGRAPKRGDDGERRQAPRSGQSRDRGQAPRSGRSSREDGRRQPPPRRRDDDDDH